MLLIACCPFATRGRTACGRTRRGRATLQELFSKRNLVLFVLAVIPTVVGSVYLYEELKPQPPRLRTTIPINRNSLLSHRFAGPCMGCHRIDEVGPVAMSRDNMQLFRLSPGEQRLLAAGQRVEVPTPAQVLRMPAILRDDILPHTFVGVCSNCHTVLAIRPSGRFMRRAMGRAYQPLATANLGAEQVARGGAVEDHRGESLRNFWGVVALILFGLLCAYIFVRYLMRTDPKRYKGKFKIKRWFTIHEWSATAFCIAAVLHWHYSVRGNVMLHTALALTLWLSAAGFVLRYRMSRGQQRKNVALLHSQRWLFWGLIALLVVGHLFSDFD